MAQSQATCQQDSALTLRPASDVMRLPALGASFAHRLSFKRTLIRALHSQKAEMRLHEVALDEEGFGHAVLVMPFYGKEYALIAYSRPLDDADRTDRVIATAWDASFCLFDGIPSAADIAQLSDEVTHQEAGQYHEKVMTLSRANKSVRLFAHVVESLADGQQPDHDKIAAIGYLMRTTAVYGNGKFGIADRDVIKEYPGLDGPFRAEMLTVYLIREFTFLLAEHVAKARGGAQASRLHPVMRRNLGVGNSTGLGMAPFLIHHPNLLHSWIMVRETAIARTRQQAALSTEQQQAYRRLADRVQAHLDQWQVDDAGYQAIIRQLRHDWATLRSRIVDYLAAPYPFDGLVTYASPLGDDFQALIASFIMEYQPDICDGLEDCMTQARAPLLEPAMTMSQLHNIIQRHYQWALAIDTSHPDARRQFWYVSEEKLEPRLGDATKEAGQDKEMPFAIAHYIAEVMAQMVSLGPDATVAELLLRYPQSRFIVRRLQNTAHFPYAEIAGNLVGAECRPIDLLRCKLSFFGASKFDPRSDRWTRITMFQGAPSAAELSDADADDWAFWVVSPPTSLRAEMA